MSRVWLPILTCSLCLSVLLGCVSKAKARRDAQAAFIAGQQEAARRAQLQAVQGPSITVNGPVNKPVLAWTEDLTLAKAILEAEYIPPGEPAEVLLVRSGRAFRLDLHQLFSGRDVPLEPGDIIQLNTNPLTPTPTR
jgi:hypothetical protein